MTYKLLIVDDEPVNLRLLDRLFSRDYYCLTASSGAEAIDLLNQHDVAILITDQRMPHMTGLELLKQTAELRPNMVRILLTGYTDAEALVEAINCGLVNMYLTKPWNNGELVIKVGHALEQYENNRKQNTLQVANERLQARLKQLKNDFVCALAETVRAKDAYCGEQATRVAEQAALLASRLSLSEEDREDLRIAASLHNLGHIGTPDVLLRRAPDTVAEQLILQAFPERGARILAAAADLRNAADMVRFHHENFDGTGYPRGLVGEQIPLTCRIIRTAQEYVRLIHPLPPAEGLSHEQAVAALRERAGTECDPMVLAMLTSPNWQDEEDSAVASIPKIVFDSIPLSPSLE
jgi:response regulator RpfG family c-di-GMP phosphodiesterase